MGSEGVVAGDAKNSRSSRVGIVVPCRNEETNIERCIQTLVSQTLKPHQILIVDDGSTDRTPHILGRLAEQYENVKVVSRDTATRDTGKGIANAVRYGIDMLELEDLDYIAKFDADLEFSPHYLERVVAVFNESPKAGLVGGVCAVFDKGSWQIERLTKLDHVRGALKCYSIAAYKDMNGIAPVTGWDTIDEHKLRFAGYEVYCIQDLIVKQHRPTNQLTDVDRMARKVGESLYHLRSSPLVLLVSILKRAVVTKPRMSASAMLAGYRMAKKGGHPVYLNSAEANFANKFRIKGFQSALKNKLTK